MVVIISMILMSTISFDAFAASDAEISKVLSGMGISSSSYAVMSGSTSEMVIDYHAERKMQPGAVAMLVTAMVVLDKMYNDEELENMGVREFFDVSANGAVSKFSRLSRKCKIYTLEDVYSGDI